MNATFEKILSTVKDMYGNGGVPLHVPTFAGNEKKYLNECIDTTFVSSVGKFVDDFEKEIAAYTGAKYAIAVVNGTAALQLALRLAGAEAGTEVITQSLSFVATANAILYNQATPVFLDVERKTWGLSPEAVEQFLTESCEKRADGTYNKITGKRIAAIVPMHTFGAICQIERLVAIAEAWNIPLVEDAAESLGSQLNGKHSGTFGKIAAVSYNGNKIITTGGGGMILTDDEELGKRAKFLSTTAKHPHAWEFNHPEMGYNFRMPNINAALGLAQLEEMHKMLDSKRAIARRYQSVFEETGLDYLHFTDESNCWLNAVLLPDLATRDAFLAVCHENNVFARPAWNLLHTLSYLDAFQHDALENSIFIAERAVNLPSSYLPHGK